MCALSHFSPVRLFATPWTVAHQASLSMGFSRQEYLSGLPLPPPGIFPTQGLNLCLLHCRQILYHWATGKALLKPLKSSCKSLKGNFNDARCRRWHRKVTWLMCFKCEWKHHLLLHCMALSIATIFCWCCCSTCRDNRSYSHRGKIKRTKVTQELSWQCRS